jgi:ribonuclease HII
MSVWEEKLFLKGYQCIAGVDEAGRGPLAGPVVAAAVILPSGFLLEGLNDSKKVLPKKRRELFETITLHSDIVFGIGIVDAKTIDRVNILQATFLAMKEALGNLAKRPDFVLIDGNQLPEVFLPHMGLVGGDALSLSIAAASIVAKETRDRLMCEMHQKWPQYQFDQHKGYGTEKHLANIREYGPCEEHRMTFEPVKSLSHVGNLSSKISS